MTQSAQCAARHTIGQRHDNEHCCKHRKKTTTETAREQMSCDTQQNSMGHTSEKQRDHHESQQLKSHQPQPQSLSKEQTPAGKQRDNRTAETAGTDSPRCHEGKQQPNENGRQKVGCELAKQPPQRLCRKQRAHRQLRQCCRDHPSDEHQQKLCCHDGECQPTQKSVSLHPPPDCRD